MRHSNQQFTFSQVPQATIPRSVFNRSFQHKTTMNASVLVPLYLDEVLPGDTFNLSASVFARLATPIFPIMDNLYLDCFFFFVPNRLTWIHWVNFCGESETLGIANSYTIPTYTAQWSLHSLADYFGIPVGGNALAQTVGLNFVVNALPFRAYELIVDEWFRDENLGPRCFSGSGDGPDSAGVHILLNRMKRHDYFTSCLPWPQKGTGVTLPLGSTAPVRGIGFQGTPITAASVAVRESTPLPNRSYAFGVATNAGGQIIVESDTTGSGTSKPLIYADLSSATAATINSLRQAFQIQKLLERDARGGTRYVEILKSHFGVTSPDFRLQRPEYLGGGSIPVVIHPVAQQSATVAGQTPKGDLSGFGIASSNRIGFSKSFVEHGYVIGLVSVRSEYTYQQGINKLWLRSTKYDFYWPALAHIGEQAVLNKEIYADNSGNDALVFGYQERWAEYRYKPSMVTGNLKSQSVGPLDAWHLAVRFTGLPVLNLPFMIDQPPMSRVQAVTTAPSFIVDSYFTVKCARPMPVYSVPGLIDHF